MDAAKAAAAARTAEEKACGNEDGGGGGSDGEADDDDEEEEEEEEEEDQQVGGQNVRVQLRFTCSSEYSNTALQMGAFNSHYFWYDSRKGFSWTRYLECMQAKAAPIRLFPQPPFPAQPPPKAARFACGMKLEAIDPEKPALMCVVTVVDVLGEFAISVFTAFPNTLIKLNAAASCILQWRWPR